MSDHMDKHQGWRQGEFIDSPRYKTMGKAWKDKQRENEKLLVRSAPTGNAICTAVSPDTAAWIAERLNVAARAEAAIEIALKHISPNGPGRGDWVDGLRAVIAKPK